MSRKLENVAYTIGLILFALLVGVALAGIVETQAFHDVHVTQFIMSHG